MTVSTQTRWGIAGTGGIARRTMPDLKLAENVDVVAVSSRSQVTANAFAEEYAIARAYGDYPALLSNPDVDVVYICTPHGAHFSMASQALRAGKHVLCEKALTLNAAQASALAELAASQGLFLMEAMWMKFNPSIRRIQETVAAGTIGPVRYVNAGFGFRAPQDRSSRFWSAAQGGGALLDLGVYPITFAQLFLAELDEFTVSGAIRDDGVDSRAMVTLSAGEAAAHLAISIEHAVVPVATVAGERGFITVDMPFWVSGGFTVYPGGAAPGAPDPIRVETPIEGAGYVPMFRAVSEAVHRGQAEHPIHPLAATVGTLTLIDRIRRTLLETHHPGLGPMEPWDSAPGLD